MTKRQFLKVRDSSAERVHGSEYLVGVGAMYRFPTLFGFTLHTLDISPLWRLGISRERDIPSVGDFNWRLVHLPFCDTLNLESNDARRSQKSANVKLCANDVPHSYTPTHSYTPIHVSIWPLLTHIGNLASFLFVSRWAAGEDRWQWCVVGSPSNFKVSKECNSDCSAQLVWIWLTGYLFTFVLGMWLYYLPPKSRCNYELLLLNFARFSFRSFAVIHLISRRTVVWIPTFCFRCRPLKFDASRYTSSICLRVKGRCY